MKVRNLAWLTGITLAACSAGEVAPVSAPMATAESGTPHAAAQQDGAASLPSDENQLAGPVLPPEVVSVMTYDQYRLTLDHGPGITAFKSGNGASDVVLGSPSVVDDPAPPADLEIE